MTLDIRSGTSVSQLQTFLDSGRTGDNVRGRKLNDGTIQLYIKPGSNGKLGLFERIASTKSRALAREGIRQVFDEQKSKAGSMVTDTVHKAVDPGFAKDVKVGAMVLLAGIAHQVKPAGVQERFGGVSLVDLGVDEAAIQGEAGKAATAMSAGGADKAAVASALGRQLGQALLSKSSNDAAVRDRFALSTGEAFKKEIAQALQSNGFEADDEFLEATRSAASHTVAHNHADDDGFLYLGGEKYKKMEKLGKGGGGEVYCWENVEDAEDRIALKTPLDAEYGKAEVLAEIRSHGIAQSGSPAHVLSMKGAVCLPDGTFGIATEIGALGDVENAFSCLDDAVTAGDISPDQALTAKTLLLRDTMKGMASVEAQELEHRDLKPGNFFISADGVAKVADFGEGVTMDDYRWDRQGMDTAYYAAPEVGGIAGNETKVREALTKIKDENKAKLGKSAIEVTSLNVSPMRAAADEVLRKQIPNLSESDRNALLSAHAGATETAVLSSTFQQGKRDAYAMGSTGHRVLFGKPYGMGQASHVNKFYERVQRDPSNRAIALPSEVGDQMAGLKTDDAKTRANDLADLVNKMTTPRARDRMSIGDSLIHDAFRGLDADEAATRKVIRDVLGTKVSPTAV